MKEHDILERVSIINVKNQLRLNEIYSTRDTIYVTCPFCNSNTGSMKLNTSNNSYICKNCDERGYSVGLYAKVKMIDNRKAYKELIKNDAILENNITKGIALNNKKSEDELDLIYSAFLEYLELTAEHTMKLLEFGFTIEEIEKIGFKSIPREEEKKISICKKLIRDGFDLNGTPGFYLDKKFRWTFNSHPGLFVPVTNNHKIISLRIHLDTLYNTDTTDIWFSSNNKNNGTKTNNNIMILLPKMQKIQALKDKKEENDIFIVSEMILAYKLFLKCKEKIVVGVPNTIPKNEYLKLEQIGNINLINLVLDTHTALHGSESLLNGLCKRFGEEKVYLNISVNNQIPEKFTYSSNNEHNEKCKMLA